MVTEPKFAPVTATTSGLSTIGATMSVVDARVRVPEELVVVDAPTVGPIDDRGERQADDQRPDQAATPTAPATSGPHDRRPRGFDHANRAPTLSGMPAPHPRERRPPVPTSVRCGGRGSAGAIRRSPRSRPRPRPGPATPANATSQSAAGAGIGLERVAARPSGKSELSRVRDDGGHRRRDRARGGRLRSAPSAARSLRRQPSASIDSRSSSRTRTDRLTIWAIDDRRGEHREGAHQPQRRDLEAHGASGAVADDALSARRRRRRRSEAAARRRAPRAGRRRRRGWRR